MIASAEMQTSAQVIQYDEPHPAGRDRRGVLVFSLSPQPVVSWKDINYALASIHGAVNPNGVRFRLTSHVPILDVEANFALAFPNDLLPNVKVSRRPGFKYIDVEPANFLIPAASIAMAAEENNWGLGPAQFLGLPTSQPVHVIRFDKIPFHLKDDFIAHIPAIFKHFAPNIEINVVDLWEQQHRISMTNPAGKKIDTWVFGWSLVVVFSFPRNLRIADIVDRWPGWYLWQDTFNIGLVFPGKFDFCGFCKFTAQDEGDRHVTSQCKKLICNKCGRKGHYDTSCKIMPDWRARKEEQKKKRSEQV